LSNIKKNAYFIEKNLTINVVYVIIKMEISEKEVTQEMELIKAGLAGLVGGVVFVFVLWLGQWLRERL
jgi:hypothetical protein